MTNIVESVRQTLAPIGATLSDTWAAIIGDKVAAWRLRNAAALQRAVHSEIAALGLEVNRARIPERYALSWFEEATKQDEPEIQQLFARLLAKAAAGDGDAADRCHLEMLTRFTPLDAKTFAWLFEGNEPEKHPSWPEYDLWRRVKDALGNASWMSIEHLMALGVLERRFDVVAREAGFMGKDEWIAAPELTPTERGMSLFRACNRPDEPAS